MKTIGILNGPNMDRLGKREPTVYGEGTLSDLERLLRLNADELSVALEFFQSNSEGALIDTIATWSDNGIAGVIFNPGAYTHTSIALRDAMSGSDLKFVEVHLSNIYRREPFRHVTITGGAAIAVISGLGFQGYVAALRYLAKGA